MEINVIVVKTLGTEGLIGLTIYIWKMWVFMNV